MMYEITDLKIDQSVYDFCKKYVDENPHDREYGNNQLLEYYPNKDFISNLGIQRYCIGVLPSGTAQEHIDEDRESCLIIPISPLEFTVLIDKKEITTKMPFVLNTSLLHGASMKEKSIFLALDFNIPFDELKEQLSNNEKYFIEISQV